jgi:adenosine kinase
MVFPGRFTQQLVPGRLAQISLSFLVDDLEVRRGGGAANIAFGLGGLGLAPLLVGAVGAEFADYEVWLKEHQVDTGAVRASQRRQTARFMCITDQDANQIASFYAGAMAEAADIDLADVVARAGGIDLLVVAANDPGAMLRHTRQARELGIPFAADPSQQLARLTAEQVRELIDGAAWLFTNEYEAALLLERTGLGHQQVLAAVGTWVTTLGERGVRIARAGLPDLAVPALTGVPVTDPTGAGDAFRAGFLAAVSHGLPPDAAARMGCTLAGAVLAEVGPQSYETDPVRLLADARETYGDAAARQLAPMLGNVS